MSNVKCSTYELNHGHDMIRLHMMFVGCSSWNDNDIASIKVIDNDSIRNVLFISSHHFTSRYSISSCLSHL